VQDLGIDNLTAADGLAVGRASGSLAGQWSACSTGSIPLMIRRCTTCWAGWRQRKTFALNRPRWPEWPGRSGLRSQAYHQLQGLSEQQLQQATHLVWATGGGMVPEEEMAQYLAKGR
jgi:D-serine dehydratase